jgi:hypothetical protein
MTSHIIKVFKVMNMLYSAEVKNTVLVRLRAGTKKPPLPHLVADVSTEADKELLLINSE